MGIPLHYAVIGLNDLFRHLSVFGGLKAVVWTDVIQVIILIFGGTIASVLVLNAVSDGQGVLLKVLKCCTQKHRRNLI
jgi:SSS family solute:Na+ symporter